MRGGESFFAPAFGLLDRRSLRQETQGPSGRAAAEACAHERVLSPTSSLHAATRGLLIDVAVAAPLAGIV